MLFSSRESRDQAVAAAFSAPLASLILGAFATFGVLVVSVAHIEIRRSRVPGRGRGAVLILLLVALLVIVNPIGAPRFVFLTVVLGLLAAWGVYRTLPRFRVIALSSIAGLVLLFPLLDTFRRSLDANIASADPLASLKEGDFDSFGQVLNAAWYVDGAGFTWGNQFLGVIFFWVPRSIWEEKPKDTGIFLAEQKGYWFTNLSAPLPAELYINWGWVGVGLGSLILGIYLRRADAFTDLKIRLEGAPGILGSVLPFYLVFLFRGSLLQATANLAVVVFCWWLVTDRPEKGEERQGGLRRRDTSYRP